MTPYNPDFEEALIQMRDILPRMWYSLYQGCQNAGFDGGQSFNLLTIYILAQNGVHLKAPDQPPKKDDEP